MYYTDITYTANIKLAKIYPRLWNTFYHNGNRVQGTIDGGFYRGRTLKSSRVESVDKSESNGAALN